MKNRKKSPPRIARWIISRLSVYEKEHALADAIEAEYFNIRDRHGAILSWIWYWFCTFGTLFHYLKLSLLWSVIMFKNYLKITLRNIKRHKTFSFINITGLIIGLVCFILIMLYIRYEMSYDAFHENSDRIFRVTFQDPGSMYMGQDSWAVTSAALAPTMMEEFPEVTYATRFDSINRLLLTKGEKSFYERGLYADEHFFDVFSFQLITSDKKSVLDDPESIIISSRLAKKFFGSDDPLGQTLNCSLGDLEIVGIVEDSPETSHIQFDCLIPFMKIQSSIETGENVRYYWWGNSNFYTYCVLKNESDIGALEKKIVAHMNKKYEDFGWNDMSYRYFLQPLESIHLKSHLNHELSVNNSDKLIRLLSFIVAFILLIACVNYMNLSSAYASKRMKEIGIRKVVGGHRSQLFRQFAGESLLISIFSLFLAVGVVYLVLPWFNRFVGKNLAFGAVTEWSFVLSMLAVIVMTGLLSGVYPAAVLSSFKPAMALKGKTGLTAKGGRFRNLLVTFQFAITIILIISSLVIFLQIKSIRERPLGYNREYVVTIPMTDPGVRKNLKAFKNSLLRHPQVIEITTSSQLPTQILNSCAARSNTDDGMIIELGTSHLMVDFNFLELFQMDIVEGRNFSEQYGTDQNDAIIVNETFVQKLNWKNPLGKRVQFWGDLEKSVVGVVKDFHFLSMHHEMKPLFIQCRPDNYYFHARIRSDNIAATLDHIRETYDRFKIRYPFEFFFLNDNFNQMYASERKLGQTLGIFSGLAVFIACLGIFGLASFAAEHRTKEIGIRKVLGASVPGIFLLLSRGFTKWVVLANLIAWPVAYYFMNKWLQNFAYRINLTIVIFILSGLAALCIAFFTASFQTIKAATANPVESLRYE